MGNLKANDVLLLVALLPVVIGSLACIVAGWRKERKAKKALAQAIRSGDEVDIAVARFMLKHETQRGGCLLLGG